MKFIMVISHDPTLQKDIEKSVDAGWFKMWYCRTTKEAMTMLGQQEPSLIVCDGRIDADAFIELARTMKIQLGQSTLTFLLLTSREKLPDQEMAAIRDSGIDDYVKWPSPQAILGLKLRSLVDRHDAQAASRESTGAIAYSFKERPAAEDESGFEMPAPAKAAEEFGLESGIRMSMPTLKAGIGEPVFQHGFGEDPEFDASQETVAKPPSGVTVDLPPGKVEQMAARILDQKMTEVARTQMKKLVASVVRAELKALLPQIVEQVKRQLEADRRS